jgi:hypothetical protein
MKKIFLFIVCTLLSIGVNSQSLIGAWEKESTAENGDKLRSLVIFSEGYQVLTIYNLTTGAFIHSNGGTWKLDGDIMTEKVEFDTDTAERVGSEISFKIKVDHTSLEIVDSGMRFTKIDNGTPGALKGAWLMSSRIRDGKSQARDTSLPRKTMKILSGTRFQWIAYNTETKQFMGTGGGTYTTINDEYSENIEFFSRDVSKVGLSLKFKYALLDANWQHRGFSSKGDPINEIWSLRQ